MKANEFFQEVMTSDICPNNFEKIYKEFQEFQVLTLNGLKELHRICEKNNISYQLAYGSLLGAIRDGGQIPWDYDVDVFVSYEEKDKLIDALQAELSSEYYLRCPEVDETCDHYFLRLVPKGFLPNILHIDVFYLIGSPKNELQRKNFAQQVEKYCWIRYGKKSNLKMEAAGNIKRYLSVLIKKKLPALRFKMDKIDENCKQLCMMYPITGSKFCLTADTFSGMYDLFSTMVMETELMDTDYGTMRVPVQYDTILKEVYGNYLEIPDLKSRMKELLFHYNRIKYFGH